MRYPIHKEVRPLRDDQVDRAEVEVQQCMELTVTNRSRACPSKVIGRMKKYFLYAVLKVHRYNKRWPSGSVG